MNNRATWSSSRPSDSRDISDPTEKCNVATTISGTKFVVLDYETSGVDPHYDAANSAAWSLGETNGEPVVASLDCRWPPGVLPAVPAVFIQNKLVSDIQKVTPTQLNMSQALRPIKRLVGYGGVVFSFGEGFERNVTQNLHWQQVEDPYDNPPFIDLRKMMLMASLCSERVVIPCKNGVYSSTLGDAARANHGSLENPHEAASDVRTEFWLLQLMDDVESEIVDMSVEQSDRRRAAQISRESAFLSTVEFTIKDGVEVEHWTESDQHSAWKHWVEQVRVDHPLFCSGRNLTYADYEDIAANRYKNLVRSFSLKSAPLGIPSDSTLSKRLVTREERAAFTATARRIRSDDQLRRAVTAQLRSRVRSKTPSEWVNGRIYERFPSTSDKHFAREFHAAEPEHKFSILARFEDDRFVELAERIVFENWPWTLDDKTRKRLHHETWCRLTSDRYPGMTIAKARAGIDEAFDRGVTERETVILNDYTEYLDRLEAGKGVVQ